MKPSFARQLKIGSRTREVVWDLTLQSSDAIRSRFLQEVEATYAKAMKTAFGQDDLGAFETLRLARESLLESVFAGDLEPWCVHLTDGDPLPPRRTRRQGDAHAIRVVLRCPPVRQVLYRFAATKSELQEVRSAVDTTGGADRGELQALLRDPRLGLLARPGANDLSQLGHAWASDARALLVLALGDADERRPTVAPLEEGWNSIRVSA